MSFFGQNIRFLRGKAQLSQTAFAEIFNLKRAAVGAYEEERAEPKVEVFVQIARHFGIPVEDLICKNLQAGEQLYGDYQRQAQIPYFDGSQLETLASAEGQYSGISAHISLPGIHGNGHIALQFGDSILIVKDIDKGADISTTDPQKVLILKDGALHIMAGTHTGSYARAWQITHIIKPYRGQDYSEALLGDISRRLEGLISMPKGTSGSAAMGRGSL